MNNKPYKKERVLSIYSRLQEGRVINKSEEAERFGVDERSIQRDIDGIRAFLSERAVDDSSDGVEVVYDRIKKGFVMKGGKSSAMTNSEIFAVSKILLESRAFTKKEMNDILSKLIEGCVPLKNMKLVRDLISNENYHYIELRHKSVLKDKLWCIGEDIKEHNVLELEYSRADSPDDTVKRIVEPVAILFSEYYFYLNAYIVERDKVGKLVKKYDYPTVFRFDRIKSYKVTGEKFRVEYGSRFEEGEFRKRVQFMYPGELIKLTLNYYGKNPEAVLDRLPTARVINKTEGCFVIEAEVYGKGIVMWLLSQGNKVEVLKPESLRQQIKQEILGMLERY
ncbi:MAG: WYL domain-containing protein [Lachnospiraceae bacterium]|nr:WYL domain-containing protein [Lachnospiraceae bacterium]